MDNKILNLKEKFVSELDKIDNLADIESIRVSYQKGQCYRPS